MSRLFMALWVAALVSLWGTPESWAGAGTEQDVQTALEAATAHPAAADAALNAGLALAWNDRLGPSLLWLERAHYLAPLDREIQDARTLVQSELRKRRLLAAGSATLTEGELESIVLWRFFTGLSPAVRAAGLVGSSWLFFMLLLLRRRYRRGAAADALGVGLLVSGLLLLGALGLQAGFAWVDARVVPAVVVDPSPRISTAPDRLAPSRRHADLYEGALVRQLERRDGWIRVTLVDGSEGWLREGIALPVVPDRPDR